MATDPIHMQCLLTPDMLGTSLTLISEMLVAAENTAIGRRISRRRVQLETLGLSLDPIITPAGITLVPQTALAKATPAELIFIPALWRYPKPTLLFSDELKKFFQRAHASGSTLAAVSNGCFLLAASGLLNGKPATTHWHFFDKFEQQFPQVQLKRDYFITQAGNLYCAASINSMADLVIHFIEQLYSKVVAQHVQRNFSHEIRRDYESMRYFEGESDRHSDETVLQIQGWLQDNYFHAVQFAEVADLFDLSVRSLNRRFKAATGTTPLTYLQNLRMSTARELLQTSNLNVSEIAYKVGYQDLGHFSALFKQSFAATPMDYRATVRAKLFNLGT